MSGLKSSSLKMASRSALTLLSSVSVLAIMGGAALADSPSLTALDWLGGGQPNAAASGISGDGQTVVGNASAAGGETHAVSWSVTGAVTDLGVGDGSYAYAANGDGSIIVGYKYEQYGYNQGFVVQSGVVSYLPTYNNQPQNVGAFGVNADGSVIVGEGSTNVSDHALMWSGSNWSTVTDLGTLGGDYSDAVGVSDDGQVVVGSSQVADNTRHGFYWQSGAMHDLTSSSPSGLYSDALAISGDGSTIVGDDDNGNGTVQQAVKWTGPGYAAETNLGTLGGKVGVAKAVNGDGSVIVGQSNLTGDFSEHAFRYANGTMSDLNTLLTNAGVDMTGIVLDDAVGISTDGTYIAANDTLGTRAYLVHYIGNIGGLTTLTDQQKAADDLADAQQGAAIQMQAFGSQLLGGDQPLDAPDKVGAFGAVGSASAGAAGKVALGGGVSLVGGLSYVKEDFRNVDMDHAAMAALALRYVDMDGIVHPFAEAGGFVALGGSYTFKRPYANGAGTATGVGSADGTMGYAYTKVGLGYDATPADELVGAVELGYSTFHTDAYDEPLTATNPFNASVSSGSDRLWIGKLEGKWTHAFSPQFDATVRLAGADGFSASSDVVTTVGGFGSLGAHDPENATWMEYGGRVGYQISDTVKADLFADGISGRKSVHAEAHVGVDLSFRL